MAAVGILELRETWRALGRQRGQSRVGLRLSRAPTSRAGDSSRRGGAEGPRPAHGRAGPAGLLFVLAARTFLPLVCNRRRRRLAIEGDYVGRRRRSGGTNGDDDGQDDDGGATNRANFTAHYNF